MLDKKGLYIRALTAVIFGASVIFLLNYSKFTIFIFLSFVGFFVAFEYIKIKLSGGFRNKVIAPLLFGVVPIAVDYFTNQLSRDGFIVLLVATLFFDFYLIYKLFRVKNMVVEKELQVYFEVLFYIGVPLLLAGNLFLLGSEPRAITVFILILLIWANDTFAYLTGSLFGKNKLMSSVSPAKTIEGFVGGGVFAILVAVILYYYFNIFPLSFYVILGVLVWIIGTLGDLIESKTKRSYNIKDSGNIMPGHGGFLDRFDSFIFVLPFMILLAYIYLK